MNMYFLTSVVLPVWVLGALAVVLPLWITPRNTRSQRRLRISVAWSAVILWILGALLMLILYAAEDADVGLVVAHRPINAVFFFLKRSALAALIWLPLLGVAWFSLAQKIERLKGKDGIGLGLGRRLEKSKTDDVGVPETLPETSKSPPK